MSNSYDIKFNESVVEYLSEVESERYYKEMFIDFCKSRMPGWEEKDNAVYCQSLIAAQFFAQSMLQNNNDIETAYENGLSVMFNAEILN